MLGVESEHDRQHSCVPRLPYMDIAGLQVEAENAVARDLAAAACEVDAPCVRGKDLPAVVVQRSAGARHRMWRAAARGDQAEPGRPCPAPFQTHRVQVNTTTSAG